MNRSKRILVYEDDEAFGYAVVQLLRNSGYHADSASTFVHALRIIEGSDPPDLLIADVAFPPGQVNGLAMARMARFKRRGMKVIYVTGFGISRMENEALGPILPKPVTHERLLSEMERVLAVA